MRSFLRQVFFFNHFERRAVPVKKILWCACLVLCTGIAHAQEVKLYTGCNMVCNGNVYMVVNNTAFKNNGIFSAGTGTAVFTGNTDTATAYIAGTSNTIFNNLTLNKSNYGIALKSSVGVKDVLTLSAGNFYSNSNLTLLSDVNNTARLAVVPAGANIYGTAMVERYIPSKRAWRLMTAPVTYSASIYNCWQNGGVYTAGKGLLISGTAAASGFDNANAASIKKWDLPTQSLLPVTSTYTNISVTNTGSADNTGYFIFIRGDRNPANFSVPNSNITTLTGIGRLQTGTQTFAAAANAGNYTLIGNPYASPIDFNFVTRGNLLKRFYIWDPSLNSVGGYVTMDDVDNDGVYSKSASFSQQTNEIQSSQAFFVETSVNGAASLTTNETAKSSSNNLRVFRPAVAQALPGTTKSLRANVFFMNTDNSVSFADGALAEFATGFTDQVTNEDAIKFSNVNESIAFTRYGVTLAIERRPLISINDTLFLKLWKTSQRRYQLQLVPVNLEQAGLVAYLEDSYLTTSTPIILSGIASINFTVDANAASAAVNRFRIVFKQLTVLPLAFTNAKAYLVKDNHTVVEWQVQDETNTVKYEVEKSATASDFKLVNTTAANAGGTYSWLDVQPFADKNFYRIKGVDRNGAIKYSQVVHVTMQGKTAQFIIRPNPVKGSSIHLEFVNAPRGDYQFNLTNSLGQVVFSTQLPIGSSNTWRELKSNTALPAGLYQLQITGPANTVESQKVIIE